MAYGMCICGADWKSWKFTCEVDTGDEMSFGGDIGDGCATEGWHGVELDAMPCGSKSRCLFPES
jgi:hypothetical protein